MTLGTWLTVAAVCTMGAMSPGPSLAVVIRNTVSGSRAHGLATAWAHASGIGFWALLTTLGLAVVLARYRALYVTLATIGALYLGWLGVQALRASGAARLDAAPRRDAGVVRAAREGFLISFLNPKIAVFFLALFSQFVHPGMPASDHLVLSATAATIDGLWYSLVALALSHPGWIEGLRRRGHWIDRVAGVVLVALAVAGLARLAMG